MYYQVAVLVTTLCNRQCPHCCYRIPRHVTLSTHHYDWSYFEEAARYLSGVEILFVTGGEPTLHPEFPRIATGFRDLFRPKRLDLVTNGYGVLEHAAVMHHFDRIHVTNFDGVSQSAIDWLAGTLPEQLAVESSNHIWMDHRGPGGPCNRRTIAAYAEGLLYPCCVGPGFPESATMKPTDNWRESLHGISLPCAVCPFSEDIQ